MPYKKYYKRRKYRSKPKLSKKTATAVKTIVKRAMKKDVELKFKSYEFGSQTSSTTPTIFTTNMPAVGQDYDERIGDWITMKSLYVNFSFAADDATNICRLIFIQWLDNTAEYVPTINDILWNGGGSYPVYAPFNKQTKQSYKVLYDRTFTLSTDGSNRIVHRKIVLNKFAPAKINFTSTAGSFVDNVRKGQIYGIHMSDSAISGPAYISTYQFNYVDA